MVENAKRNYHRFRMRLRRKVRKQRHQVEDISLQADDMLDKHVFRRFGHLKGVRRFVASWVLLVLFVGLGAIWQVKSLDSFYLQLVPASGGIYREGMIGSFTSANPLFAVNDVDSSVARLVFSGLFKLSPEGVLEPDLATGYEINSEGDTYTVHLKNDVKWQDGQPFTAQDVVFTYERIKNPEVKSPLFTGWSAIKLEAKDDYTINFNLPNTLSSFPYSMTNGIVPKHLLENIPPVDLRSTNFNTVEPIGTGPFRFSKVEVLGDSIQERQEKVTLETNSSYFGKKPTINGINIRTFRDEDAMLESFKKQEIAGMVGLETLRDDVQDSETVLTFSTPLSGQVLLFLKNSNPILIDANVRRALLRATDTETLRKKIGYELVESDSPFIKSHFSYDAAKVQQHFDKVEAEKLLDAAGWVKNAEGIREKDGQKLSLRLVSQSISEYATVAQLIQEQWGEIGVAVDAVLQPEEDVQTGAIIQHDYDVLLYGVSLGPDPDVFAFWHSSQADPRLKSRLNLSEYNNKTADLSLEAGRTRTDIELRKLKYGPFLDAWLADVPAIALYQPRFLFVVRGTLEGYRSGQFTNAADRFYSVSDWQIRREKTVK